MPMCCSSRLEYQLSVTFTSIPGSGVAQPVLLVLRPGPELAAVVGDEVVVLVRGEGGAHRVHEETVELGPAHPVEHHLVQVGQPAAAEVRVGGRLEVLV